MINELKTIEGQPVIFGKSYFFITTYFTVQEAEVEPSFDGGFPHWVHTKPSLTEGYTMCASENLYATKLEALVNLRKELSERLEQVELEIKKER